MCSAALRAPIATLRSSTPGAALVIAGKAGSIKEGVAMGDAAIRSGAARRTLDRLVAASNA